MTENRGKGKTTKGRWPGERDSSWVQIIGYRSDTYITKQTQQQYRMAATEKTKNMVHNIYVMISTIILRQHRKKKLTDRENRNKKQKQGQSKQENK